MISITSKGAILLGNKVSCDGFFYDNDFRIQTHVHEDHLRDFSSSLAYQIGVVTTQATLDLIAVVKNNPALHYRDNIHIINLNGTKTMDGLTIEFKYNRHMLGSVQVAITYQNGKRLGYSGDFSWPLDEVIQVDELVVDCTYGDPDSVRELSRESMEDKLLELVADHVALNPVVIKGHRGTILRAMNTINEVIKTPILVSNKLYKEIVVYNKHGYGFNNYYSPKSGKYRDIFTDGHYIRFCGVGEEPPSDVTTISLSGIFGRNHEPITSISENSFVLTYSDHADFNETIEYIKETRAKKVITDPTRSGTHRARTLARQIKQRLNISANAFNPQMDNRWGH